MGASRWAASSSRWRRWTFQKFVPSSFLESGDVLVVLCQLEATVKATGRCIVEEDEVHVWYFSGKGQVSRFRHRADTHQQWAAYTAN